MITRREFLVQSGKAVIWGDRRAYHSAWMEP